MKIKKFHLGDVLSITTQRLVSPRHMVGVYDILNFMTGDNLFTHQLPRAANECKPYLLEQFPKLAEVDASGVNTNNSRPLQNTLLSGAFFIFRKRDLNFFVILSRPRRRISSQSLWDPSVASARPPSG